MGDVWCGVGRGVGSGVVWGGERGGWGGRNEVIKQTMQFHMTITNIRIAYLLPLCDAPLPKYSAPLLPLLAVPVDRRMAPLMPVVPALAVCGWVGWVGWVGGWGGWGGVRGEKRWEETRRNEK